ncbi:MAG: hypothetical protein GYA34_01030 [Chloroflexi bacterium]|nr:hypothetical protein [Chloroflexota bacterium]
MLTSASEASGTILYKMHPASQDVTPVCLIQGDYFRSDFTGQVMKTQGVVTLDLDQTSKKGFFIQKQNCDGDPATSDGVFVNLGISRDIVSMGDYVEVQGVVEEDYGNTQVSIITGTVSVLSRDAPLPDPIDLRPPMNNNTSRWYYESLESMRVSLDDALVTGPSDSSDNIWVVRSDLGIQRVYQDDPAGTGEVICVGDGGLFKTPPQTTVGDQLLNLSGVLEFDFGEYRMQLTNQPILISHAENSQAVPYISPKNESAITMATLNLQDMFDTVNDPATKDKVLSFPEYIRRLQKFALLIHDKLGEPDLIAVQEAENDAVLKDLIAFKNIQADYQTLLVEGPDLRGQDVALLYRADRVEIVESQVYQDCTTLADGLGVDGNQDVYNPVNNITCDTNGDGLLDGNRLFSRPPLRVRLKVCIMDCQNQMDETGWVEMTLLINHFKSKYEDGSITPFTLPRRLQEAQFIASLTQQLHTADPDGYLFVLGDLNDYPASQPLTTLTAAGLRDLTQIIPHDDRFTYNYHGVSQGLDYVLFYPVLGLVPMDVQAFHVNADYPHVLQSQPQTYYRSSDHDPLLVILLPMPYQVNLPLGVR